MFSPGFWKRRSLRVRDDKRTNAAELTLRQSIYPICLVTVLFFLWGFSYGLLDTLNKHFQNTLDINKARSSGLQVAYFGYVDSLSVLAQVVTDLATEHTPSPRWDMRPGFCATMATAQSSSGASSCTGSAPSWRFPPSRRTRSAVSAFAFL
jgi:hypothetical protein